MNQALNLQIKSDQVLDCQGILKTQETTNIFDSFWLYILIFWDQYTVGGTSVTIPYGGLTDGAITISLNGESITIPGGSSIFEFPGTLVYDDDFEVNIVNYPPGQDCVVVNGVQVVTGNINNVEIICTASNGDNLYSSN